MTKLRILYKPSGKTGIKSIGYVIKKGLLNLVESVIL